MTAAKRDRRPGDTGPAADRDINAQGQEGIYSGGPPLASLSPVLIAEITRLFNAGFWLLPLGLGDEGRKPALKFKRSDGTSPIGRHPLDLVIRKMQELGSSNYAVRLNGMLVVDIDTDTPEAHEYVARWFGASPVQTKTGKGVHHWYHFSGQKPPDDVRIPGIHIDFKAGPLELAAGPFAERQDGVHYWPLKGRLETLAALPEFVDRRPAVPEPEVIQYKGDKVAAGSRNRALYTRAIEYVTHIDTLDELVDDLLAYRNIHFDEPATVPDAEVRGVAKWAWGHRLNNTVWARRESGVIINRSIGDRLLAKPYGSDAFALYYMLKANHGHLPGKRFAVVPDAVRKSGLLNLCRNHIRAALDMLIDEGLLIRHPQTKPGQPCEFQLTGGVGREDIGESVSSYIVTQIGTHNNEGLAA
ncbi:hypothetical protein NKI51_10805 [Mesorhizobium australicum]|uniref:hypothetical protein n=1 Tax=Mesorhizobium australicum TaxID=536018 RepID=UPI00333A4106